MRPIRTWLRRIRLAYALRCAREDARAHDVVVPEGLWVCERCTYVGFSQLGLDHHRVSEHV